MERTRLPEEGRESGTESEDDGAGIPQMERIIL